jgi:hypothetical protein
MADEIYLNALQRKLADRIESLTSHELDSTPLAIKRFLTFVEQSPLLCGILDELRSKRPSCWISGQLEQLRASLPIGGENDLDAAIIGYYVLRDFGNHSNIIVQTSRYYGEAHDDNTYLQRFWKLFLEPFRLFLTEALVDEQVMLYFLQKYKHRCEWFRREQLHHLATDETGKAESSLAFDLYKYLHDQGIDFSIEPISASGCPDLITEQVGDDRVVADAKVFWPERSKGKPYIISGFNQVYTYLRDYNEPFGYLVIFKMCKDDLKFMVPPTTAMFPSLSHNNKTIFFVVVDICQYESTASKRGQLKVHEITADDLIHAIQPVDEEVEPPAVEMDDQHETS